MKWSLQAAIAAMGTGFATPVFAQCDPQEILPPEAEAQSKVGAAMALDGETLVLGDIRRDLVYVMRRGAMGGWVTVDVLGDEGVGPKRDFGAEVAIDGNLLLVGDPAQGSGKGRVHAYRLEGASWIYEGALPDAVEGRFGIGIDIEESTAVVGAHRAGIGSALVYERAFGVWRLAATLQPGGNRFGFDVAMQDDTIVVGAPTPGNRLDGRLYVFERPVGGWSGTVSPDAKLEDSSVTSLGSRLGHSVAIDGDVIVGGANQHGAGAAFVFRQQGGSWTSVNGASLVLDFPNSDNNAEFGASVALWEGQLVVGAPAANGIQNQNSLPNAGRAFVYDLTNVSPIAKPIFPPGQSDRDRFGEAVLLDDEGNVLGGASQRDGSGLEVDSGLVYLFFEDGCTPTIFCEGGSEVMACPCGATAAPGEGCSHSDGGGMRANPSGVFSITNDTFQVRVANLPVGNTGAFFVGTARVAPSPLFEGLNCVGGDGMRFRGVAPSGGAVVGENFFQAAPGFFNLGELYYFQYCSRDNFGASPPCPRNAGDAATRPYANLSPAVEVRLVP